MERLGFGLVGLNVSDAERSIAFYTGVLGMKLAGRFGDEQMTEIALSMSGDLQGADPMLILVVRRPAPALDLGTGFSRIGFFVRSAAEVVERARAAGHSVTMPPREVAIGGSTNVYAFVQDPDGYGIELVERRPST